MAQQKSGERREPQQGCLVLGFADLREPRKVKAGWLENTSCPRAV